MQSTVPAQTEKTPDYEVLLVASLILRDVNRTVRNIRMFVALLLRYVVISASITDGLMGMVIPGVPEDY